MARILISVLVGFLGCTKFAPRFATPEEAVRKFLERSGAVSRVSDKQNLEVLCVGEMRRVFGRMTDEAFQVNYVGSEIQIKDLKFLEVQKKGKKARVYYRLVVENQGGKIPTEEIIEREVDVVFQHSTWFLESIRAKGSDKISFRRGMIF